MDDSSDEESGVELISEWPVTSGGNGDGSSTTDKQDEPSLTLPKVKPFVHNHNFTFNKSDSGLDDARGCDPVKRKMDSGDALAALSLPSVGPSAAPVSHFLDLTQSDTGSSSCDTDRYLVLKFPDVQSSHADNKPDPKRRRLNSDSDRVRFFLSEMSPEFKTSPDFSTMLEMSNDDQERVFFFPNNSRRPNVTVSTIFGETESMTSSSDSTSSTSSTSGNSSDENSDSWDASKASDKRVLRVPEVKACGSGVAGGRNQAQAGGAVGGKRTDNSCELVDNEKDHPVELMAQTRLARWWRRHGQRLVTQAQMINAPALPKTTNPNTLLFHVARLPEGREFLRGERQMLRRQNETGRGDASSLAALASVEEWLGNTDDAVKYFKQALDVEPQNKEWKWMLHKLERQQTMRHRQAELMKSIPPTPVFPKPTQVERVSCRGLSFAEFFHRFAIRHKPVIITDFVPSMTTVPWNFQHIKDVAGDCTVKVKHAVLGSVEWAGLEESRLVTVSRFLTNLHTCQDYLFDWSLPIHCPNLVKELTIPRYFAGDFLQRTAPASLYHDSWPSLFIAPAGLRSGLHVDAFASNFWMALFQGRKKWVFFREEDTPCLYPVYAHSLDPVFEVKVTDPNLEAHPLTSLVHPMECVLNPGEILFVPGGSPHYVENLDDTLAISSNFVDLSNFRKVIQELEVNSLVDPRAADLLNQFRQASFPSAMKSDITDLPYKEFNSFKSNVKDFDLTESSLED